MKSAKAFLLKFNPSLKDVEKMNDFSGEFLLYMMSEYAKGKAELLEALIRLNEGFKSEWGDKDNSDRVCKNIDYWNKLASKAIKKATQ